MGLLRIIVFWIVMTQIDYGQAWTHGEGDEQV